MLIIGNLSSVDELSKNDIRKLFTGQNTILKNGKRVVIVELKEGMGGKRQFHDISTARTDAQLASSWSILIFTGKAEAPIEVESYEDVIAIIKENPNAIGYIHESALTDEVKVLFRY